MSAFVRGETTEVSPTAEGFPPPGTHLDILEVIAESLYHLVCDQMAAAGKRAGC